MAEHRRLALLTYTTGDGLTYRKGEIVGSIGAVKLSNREKYEYTMPISGNGTPIDDCPHCGCELEVCGEYVSAFIH